MNKFNELVEKITIDELLEMIISLDLKERIIERYIKSYSDDSVFPSESLKMKLYDFYEEESEEDKNE